MRALRSVALGVLVAVSSAACGQHSCPGGCPGFGLAAFNLSCSATDLTSVALSGPCADTDSGLASTEPAKYLYGAGNRALSVTSLKPGTCHVVLSFASGFTYSADVVFTSQTTEPAGCCPAYVAPTQPSFLVDNPNQTCLDAGP
jgi:hypothetical protein